MDAISIEKRKEYEITGITRMLFDLHRETKDSPKRLSISELAKKHDVSEKYVHTMREMKVFKSQKFDQGEKSFRMYTWNFKEPSDSVSEVIYNKTKSTTRLKAVRKLEEGKYKSKLQDKNLQKICHTTLRAPGTVLLFVEKIYKACPVVDIANMAKSDNSSEMEVNNMIILYLERSKIIVTDANRRTVWNDDDAPTIDMAILISGDLMQGGTYLANDEHNINENMEKSRKPTEKTLALKQGIKELLLDGRRGYIEKNPVLRFRSATARCVIKPMFKKLPNGKFQMEQFPETIDAKCDSLYTKIQEVQKVYLDRAAEKKNLSGVTNVNKPKTQSEKVDSVAKLILSPHTEHDVTDFFATAERLKNLKDTIINSVREYKKILKKMNFTDKKLAEEIGHLLE